MSSAHGPDHHSTNPEHKKIGIFISLIAVLMAVVGAFAKAESNEMIVREVKASNGFAWYQAKRQRSYLNELELKRIAVQLAGTGLAPAQVEALETTRAALLKKERAYRAESGDIEKAAKADQQLAAHAAHRHHRLEFAEICLHVAVVLCSLMLLTNQKLFLHLGAAATLIGVCVAAVACYDGRSHSETAQAQAPQPPAGEAPAAH